MVKDKIAEAIKFFENCLKEKGLKVSKIILFGSHSTGKATIDSDVDILIISPDFQNKGIFERARLTKEAEINTIKKFRLPKGKVMSGTQYINCEKKVSRRSRSTMRI